MRLFNTWKTVMFDPLKFFEKLPAKIGYREPSLFFLKVQAITLGLVYLLALLFGSFFLLVISAATGGMSLGVGALIFLGALLIFPLLLLFAWGMLFVAAGITHLLVLIFGGKQGYKETFKATAYSMAPNIFSIIPIVNWAAGIYSIVLQIMGIKHRQKLSWGKSVAVVLIPIGLVFVAVFIFYFFFMMTFLVGGLAAAGAGGFQ